jgi:uncharacterized membrane protein YidH (DUF202 family)
MTRPAEFCFIEFRPNEPNNICPKKFSFKILIAIIGGRILSLSQCSRKKGATQMRRAALVLVLLFVLALAAQTSVMAAPRWERAEAAPRWELVEAPRWE